ncbi:MAG: hypothetical protein IKR41_04960 [Bacteroidales bacterium]|nr:hypothetical protein [Bacteroidales bacterium]
MKNLQTEHILVKQNALNALINANVTENRRYANIKAALLNSAAVCPLPSGFSIGDFRQKLLSYLKDTLSIDTREEILGGDVYSYQFSPIGLGLMKKTVIFTVLDSHLYINVVPLKEIENLNYTSGVFSDLLNSLKNVDVFSFAQEYILSLYPVETVKTVQPEGRYFFSSTPALPTVLASHIEEQEKILAKLDIYKVEKTKLNIEVSESDLIFYVLTTLGSYLFVTDKNSQEKYIENLTGIPMNVQSRIGRDTVTVGQTKWITMRDNDFLFDEISSLNDKSKEEKIWGIASESFNKSETKDEKMYSANLISLYHNLTGKLFDKFVSSFIKYCALLGSENVSQAGVEVIESANSLFSETEFEPGLKKLLTSFEFSSDEISSLIFVLLRVKNRISDVQSFKEALMLLKEKLFKLDNSNINRAFTEICIACKFNNLGEHKAAFTLLEDALEKLPDMVEPKYLPIENSTPGDKFSTSALYTIALEEIFKTCQSDKDRLRYSKLSVLDKPLIIKNMEVLSKYLVKDNFQIRFFNAMSIFDVEKFNSFSSLSDYSFTCQFKALPEKKYAPELFKPMPYSSLKDYLAKIIPDQSISSIRQYAEKITKENFPQLDSMIECCRKCFEMPEVEVFAIKGRNQGFFSNDDGQEKYIIIDAEMLEEEGENSLNYPEMIFLISKEFYLLKSGFSKLTSHGQFRYFDVLGRSSIDIISQYAPNPSFIFQNVKDYAKLMKFSELMYNEPEYLNFDVTDYELSAELLKSTLEALDFKSVNKPNNQKEKEFEALSLLIDIISDRVGLLMSNNIVYSVTAIIKNDKYIKGGMEFLKTDTAVSLALARSSDSKVLNKTFSMRLSALVSFYLSDEYEQLQKVLRKK